MFDVTGAYPQKCITRRIWYRQDLLDDVFQSVEYVTENLEMHLAYFEKTKNAIVRHHIIIKDKKLMKNKSLAGLTKSNILDAIEDTET